MKKFLVVSLLAFVFAIPSFVRAEDSTSLQGTSTPGTTGVSCPQITPPGPDFCVEGRIVMGRDERGCLRPAQCVRPALQNIRQEIQDTRQETRTNIQGQRMDLREDIMSGRANLLDEIKARLQSGQSLTPDEVQAFKEKRGTFQEEVRSKVETFRQSVEAEREGVRRKIEAAREALQQRLEQFRDGRKKQIVERLAKGLDDLNAKIVGQFTDALGKLDQLLVNISSRADKAEANGHDVSAVRSAITDAQAAIAAARAAVQTQAGKTYPIQLTSEDTARTDISLVKQTLEADLKTVRALVQAAREAVRNAVQALRQIPGVDSFEFSTSTTPAAP